MSKSTDAAAAQWARRAQITLNGVAAAGTAVERLEAIAKAGQLLEKATELAVTSARDDRWTWAVIAETLHLHLATAHRRYAGAAEQHRDTGRVA